jgi:hypothetical protein
MAFGFFLRGIHGLPLPQALITPALERPFCLLYVIAYASMSLCLAQDCCLAFAKLPMLAYTERFAMN